MNLNPILNRFMELVTYDQSLRSLEQELLTVVDEIIDLEESRQHSASNAIKAHEMVRALRKNVDVKELQMKEIEAQVSAIKAKLGVVSNSREYDMVSKELDRVHHDRNLAEDELLSAWNDLENAQKIAAKEDATVYETAASITQQIAEKNEVKNKLEAELLSKDQERAMREKDVPAQWLADYARIKRIFLNPVVPLENGSCSACYESLSAQQVTDLARKQLYPCPGCFRFLYNKP